ncbi:hypothetical protein [uncultured Paraglaciecola sp.]|nr:hypothetical protein [uncultured Paraglaciecola sp.]
MQPNKKQQIANRKSAYRIRKYSDIMNIYPILGRGSSNKKAHR